ncbi:PREDICTED: uncharacterized protein LOC106329413 [Brassica oleracea var. oleracea]|uniref:Uncharacterized protein n=1 Tax=Brassica oleracea var. oleracea TaxID=109376 RepID=A0A0D3BJ66_BRAOL|nr:PREDICTED: uncharacterized protein LOC106329413 [Brassica oleracea var. oleracea]
MDSQEHNITQHSPGGGKSHVCSKCGWNYPNPHPSAKNRRAHKKICGTIKGFEILGSEQANQNLDLQKGHCLDDEPKTPSPRVVDERIGDIISEEDVFADAVCEFSSSLVSDSVKEKEEETAANGMAKSATDLGETQECNKSPEVVKESLDVLLPVQVLENFPSSAEAADTCGESSSQVIHDGRSTISNVGLEAECKGNVADESESRLAASALGKRVDTSWNDEVIYSDLEGPHGFEEMNMNPPGEADDYTAVSDKNPVDTPPVETIADQVINTSLSALDAIPFAENAHVSLHGTKALEDELPLEDLSIGRDVPSPDKTEPQGQSPSAENIVMPKIDPEETVESSFGVGASQETVESETVRTSLPAVDPFVADSNADVSHSDLISPESELTQANVVADEEKSTISELSSQSSCAVEHYVSPVSVVSEGDEPPSVQNKSSTETSKDSTLQIGAEACESTAEEDCTKTNQKLVESGRTESNRVVGGLGVIQANEIDGNLKTHNNYAEVPVTIESNDHRDFGRLQNLSEAHIRSLVLSPIVTRDNAVSGHSEPENESQSSSLDVGLSKNQEITTSWSTAKEQHVPLKNLLNEARSPRVEATTSILRVSAILEQGTSPEDEGGWPERREVSEEWNSPAKYPAERKVKGRPFWVPFVCCSSSK